MKKSVVLLLLVGSLSFLDAHAFQEFEVKRIRVVGLKRVSEAAVLNDLPIQVGQRLTEEEATTAIRALYQTGFFKNVTLAKDGNTLVIEVTERPTISRLSITGIKDKEKILKVLRDAGIAEGRLFDPALVAKGQRELEKYYFSKGRYAVRIEPQVTELEKSLIHLQFCITEGDSAKICQISIVGNCCFSETELLKELHSSKTNWLSWFTNDDQYAKEKLAADLENLRSFYMDRGYIHFQVDSSQVSLTPDKKQIYITIHVTEGDQYVYGRVCLEGDFVVDKECFMPILARIKPGCTFSRKQLLEVKQALEDRLGDEGYSGAEARLVHTINENTKEVHVSFQIVPGNRVYVRRIQFVGNATTQDEVLRRELPQMEGTWVSTSLIKEGKEKILRRGFASNIEVETIPVAGTRDQVDLVYKIEEAKMGQIAAGLAYSATEKLMFNFSISQENFFGTGKMVDFTFDKSKATSNYAFGYQDPYFTVDGVGMGFSGYYSKNHYSKTTFVSDYIMDMVGGEFRWAFPMSKYEAISASVGYDDTHIKVNRDTAATEILAFIRKYGHNFQEVVFSLGWGYDSLDQRLFPKRGATQTARASLVAPGAKQQYYKLTYNASLFHPLGDSDRWIVNLIANLGFADGYGKTPQLPFYRNFVAGGTRTVRGFEENSLGPKDSRGRAIGGNLLIAGTASLIFPNPIKPDAKSIRTALFLDAGQVYDTRHRRRLGKGLPPATRKSRLAGDIRYSIGLSLTWNSPLGAPLTFSLAQPLNAKRGDEKRLFTFWMGTQF